MSSLRRAKPAGSHPTAGFAPLTYVLVTAVLGLLAGCVPDLDSDESTLRAPRVIAVIAEPAEAAPDQDVKYSALLVDEQGIRTDGALVWFYCGAQKPLAELGPVNTDCLSPSSGKLARLGTGLTPEGAIPTQACALFGPNLPPPMEGQLPGRPVDPDDTGGYKQPLVIGVNTGGADDLLLFEQRILCDLPGVTPQLLLEYKLRYHANQNPQIDTVEVTRADGEVLTVGEGETLALGVGETVRLAARWADCPAEDSCGDGICGPDESRVDCSDDCSAARLKGCTGQERYLWFNTQSRLLEERREAMRASWYTTRGAYEDERTGLEERDPGNDLSNVWQAPAEPGPATLLVVIRDARGGTGYRALNVDVR